MQILRLRRTIQDIRTMQVLRIHPNCILGQSILEQAERSIFRYDGPRLLRARPISPQIRRRKRTDAFAQSARVRRQRSPEIPSEDRILGMAFESLGAGASPPRWPCDIDGNSLSLGKHFVGKGLPAPMKW